LEREEGSVSEWFLQIERMRNASDEFHSISIKIIL
jgi:hypothetical protein